MSPNRWHFGAGLWPTVATLSLLPLLLWLAVWQFNCSGEKELQIRAFGIQAKAAPVALNTRLAYDGQTPPYLRVQLHGALDASHSFLLDNRTRKGVAGYHVLTPLRTKGKTLLILVNRGWVPVGQSRDLLPDVRLTGTAERTVSGLLAPPPRPGWVMGDTGYGGDTWPRVVQLVDLEAMTKTLGAKPSPYLLLLAPTEPDGFDRAWRAHSGISPERHLGYALQWFSLAVALIVIYVAGNLRKRKPERDESS